MSFIERAFTPPGSTPPPLGSPQNPIPVMPTAPGAGAVAPPPAPPAAPPTPAGPPSFRPATTPGQKAQAQRSATTMLGAAAAAGQTAKAKTTLG